MSAKFAVTLATPTGKSPPSVSVPTALSSSVSSPASAAVGVPIDGVSSITVPPTPLIVMHTAEVSVPPLPSEIV